MLCCVCTHTLIRTAQTTRCVWWLRRHVRSTRPIVCGGASPLWDSDLKTLLVCWDERANRNQYTHTHTRLDICPFVYWPCMMCVAGFVPAGTADDDDTTTQLKATGARRRFGRIVPTMHTRDAVVVHTAGGGGGWRRRRGIHNYCKHIALT